MDGYRPVDLGAACNAGLDAIDTRRVPPVGEQVFHGIPFRIGRSEGSDPCFVLLEPDAGAIEAPIGRIADRVVVAHRRLRRGGPEGDPAPGTVVAEYVFHLQDGSTEPDRKSVV